MFIIFKSEATFNFTLIFKKKRLWHYHSHTVLAIMYTLNTVPFTYVYAPIDKNQQKYVNHYIRKYHFDTVGFSLKQTFPRTFPILTLSEKQ